MRNFNLAAALFLAVFLTVAAANTSSAQTELFSEDFSTHADWAAESAGATGGLVGFPFIGLPAAGESAYIGEGLGINNTGRTPNGWAFDTGGNNFNDTVALTNEGVAGDINFDFGAPTSAGVGLSLKNWSTTYREISLAGVMNDSVTLQFDYWFPANVNGPSTPNNFSFAVLDDAPADQDSGVDWAVAGDEDRAFAASTTESVSFSVDTSGFTGGSFFVAFHDNGWNAATQIDNVVVSTVPEPASLALLLLSAVACVSVRRK